MMTTHTAGDVLAIVHELESSFQGDLILPGVSLYDAARRVWNVAALRVGRVRQVDIATCAGGPPSRSRWCDDHWATFRSRITTGVTRGPRR